MPTADSLANKATLRKQFLDELAKKAAFVRINPHSVLKGTLGGQQEVASGDVDRTSTVNRITQYDEYDPFTEETYGEEE